MENVIVFIVIFLAIIGFLTLAGILIDYIVDKFSK
jgi:hypothetical protein